jgi:AcrR family transcriptional regulator
MAKRADPFARQGYHHGNLKQALVAAARQLIAERGPAGFTLVEAARRAGVSPAAPYRHFKDRDALIAEVARRGFEEFSSRMAAAWGAGTRDPREGFAAMGAAYLAFARAEPGYYGAMFAPSGAHPHPPPPGEGPFAGLEHAVARVAALQGGEGTPASRMLAFQVWALSHGVATLAAAGQLPDEPGLNPETMLKAAVGALIAGTRGGAERAPAAAERDSGQAPSSPALAATKQPRRSKS